MSDVGCYCCAVKRGESKLWATIDLGPSGKMYLCPMCWAERFPLGMTHERARSQFTAFVLDTLPR